MSVATASPAPSLVQAVPIEAMQLYEKLRPQLAGVSMAVFVQQFWNKGLQAQLQGSVNARAANPYPEADRVGDKLRLHYEAQVRAALSGVAELLQNKPHTKCDSLMQKGDVIKDVVQTRCAAFGRHSNPIQTLQALGINNPADFHQQLCSEIAHGIGDLWPAYSAKKDFQYNNAEKFVSHFAKRLIAKSTVGSASIASGSTVATVISSPVAASMQRTEPPGLGDCIVPLTVESRPGTSSPISRRSGLVRVQALDEPMFLEQDFDSSPDASISHSSEESSGLQTPPMSSTLGMDRIGMQPIAHQLGRMPELVDIPSVNVATSVAAQSAAALPPRPALILLHAEALPPRPQLISLESKALPPHPGLFDLKKKKNKKHEKKTKSVSAQSSGSDLPPRPALIPLHSAAIPEIAAMSGLRPLSADHPLVQKLAKAQTNAVAASAATTSPTINVAMSLLQKFLDSDAALALPGNAFVFFAPSDAKMQAQSAADIAAISSNTEATRLFTMCHLCPDVSPHGTVTNRQWTPLHSSATPIIVGSTLKMVQPGVEAPQLAVQSLYMHPGKNIAVRIFSHDNIILPN